MKKVKIISACVTSEGDRFAGDEYSGDGKKALVDSGLAEWIIPPVVVTEEPGELSTNTLGVVGGTISGEGTEGDVNDTAESGTEAGGQSTETDINSDGAGEGDSPPSFEYSMSKLCSVAGCRRLKTALCPSCKEPICPDHMDETAGMCLLCLQGSDE